MPDPALILPRPYLPYPGPLSWKDKPRLPEQCPVKGRDLIGTRRPGIFCNQIIGEVTFAGLEMVKGTRDPLAATEHNMTRSKQAVNNRRDLGPREPIAAVQYPYGFSNNDFTQIKRRISRDGTLDQGNRSSALLGIVRHQKSHQNVGI